MNLNHPSYRAFLRDELATRTGRNRAYSLRSFAKHLEMVPSMLSGILNGKKNLSGESAIAVATRLGLEGKALDHFCLLVQLESAKTPALKESIQAKINALRPENQIFDLSVDHFRMISDWYHLPIWEMAELDPSQFTPKAIAKRLGISAVEAEAAIGRLERLELLERDEKGHLRKTHNHLVVRSQTPNSALRSYHVKMLEKAKDALENQTPAERVTNTQNVAMDPEKIEEAKELTREYIGKMLALAESSKSPNRQIYHLGVQMFRLTDLQGEKS